MFSIFAFMSEWVEFYARFGLNITIYYSIVNISMYLQGGRQGCSRCSIGQLHYFLYMYVGPYSHLDMCPTSYLDFWPIGLLDIWTSGYLDI